MALDKSSKLFVAGNNGLVGSSIFHHTSSISKGGFQVWTSKFTVFPSVSKSSYEYMRQTLTLVSKKRKDIILFLLALKHKRLY